MSVNIKAVLKGSAISLAISLLIIFVLSLLAYSTQISDSAVTIGAYIAVIVGIMAGSFLIARAAPAKKLMHVALMCVFFVLVLLILSMVLNGRILFNAHTAGIVGGIFAAAFFGAVIGNR